MDEMVAIVYGEHRGIQVEVEYDPAVAVFLRERAQRIADRARNKNNERMASNFEAEVGAWDAVITSPDLLNLVDEFEDIRKIYLDHVLYDEHGFQADMTTE